MLGLGSTIISSPKLGAFNIADVSGIQTWLKFNTGQTDDGDRITWNDSSGQGNPINDASAGTNDRVEFTGGALHLKQLDGSTHPEANFTTEIDLTGAFTIFMVIDVADDLNTETILQGSGTNFFRMSHGNVDTTFRYKFAGNDNIVSASTAPSTSKALFRFSRNGSNEFDVFEDNTSLGGGFPDATTFPPLLGELEVFTYEYNPKTRNIRYGHPSGLHDDCVISLAIANYNRKQNKTLGTYAVMGRGNSY